MLALYNLIRVHLLYDIFDLVLISYAVETSIVKVHFSAESVLLMVVIRKITSKEFLPTYDGIRMIFLCTRQLVRKNINKWYVFSYPVVTNYASLELLGTKSSRLMSPCHVPCKFRNGRNHKR